MNQIHTNNIPTQGIQRHCEAQTSFIDALTQILQTSIPGANLCQTSMPQCEKISLWLLNANYPQWELNNEQAAHIMGQPPFWSFCWASGQVLAAHLLSNPNHVKNKTVVDFGAGSGVVGIAAKLAGASRVIACDSDPAARIACQANAQLNDVALEVVDSFDAAPAADIITIADVFYDRDNLPMLEAMQKKYNTLWVADSRLKGQTLPGLFIAGCAESFTVPDLSESSEFNHVNIYTSAV